MNKLIVGLCTTAFILACASGNDALADNGRSSYVPFEDTVIEMPLQSAYACSADGWLINMDFEIRSSQEPVALVDVYHLANELTAALQDNISIRDHDTVSITPGSAFRADVLAMIDPLIDQIENGSDGRLHVGLADGNYQPVCPVA